MKLSFAIGNTDKQTKDEALQYIFEKTKDYPVSKNDIPSGTIMAAGTLTEWVIENRNDIYFLVTVLWEAYNHYIGHKDHETKQFKPLIFTQIVNNDNRVININIGNDLKNKEKIIKVLNELLK